MAHSVHEDARDESSQVPLCAKRKHAPVHYPMCTPLKRSNRTFRTHFALYRLQRTLILFLLRIASHAETISYPPNDKKVHFLH